MHTYFEIVKFDREQVVQRLDVTKESQHNRDRIDRGANINLNHEDYFTRFTESDEPLDEIH